MSRARCSEGGKRQSRRPYVAFVEGVEHGVPYRVFFKRMDCAERLAKNPGAVLVCLTTLTTKRWVHGCWVITT